MSISIFFLRHTVDNVSEEFEHTWLIETIAGGGE